LRVDKDRIAGAAAEEGSSEPILLGVISNNAGAEGKLAGKLSANRSIEVLL